MTIPFILIPYNYNFIIFNEKYEKKWDKVLGWYQCFVAILIRASIK